VENRWRIGRVVGVGILGLILAEGCLYRPRVPDIMQRSEAAMLRSEAAMWRAEAAAGRAEAAAQRLEARPGKPAGQGKQVGSKKPGRGAPAKRRGEKPRRPTQESARERSGHIF
jgi:hypothetical protein